VCLFVCVIFRDFAKRITEVEMDLTLAKSQGYLRSKPKSDTRQKLLAVIGVYTGFGSRLKRNVFRGSWMPRGDALKKLEEKGVIVRFVIGRGANRGDSLDRNIDEENRLMKDLEAPSPFIHLQYIYVYKVILADGSIVAIKRALEGSLQGEEEFLTEIELLSRVHHRNLVALMG
ncbi:hypothetical protein IFM89_028060, partial [Coptis chinensis]